MCTLLGTFFIAAFDQDLNTEAIIGLELSDHSTILQISSFNSGLHAIELAIHFTHLHISVWLSRDTGSLNL